MTDRVPQIDPSSAFISAHRLIVAATIISAILITLGVVTLALLANERSGLQALRTTSSRTECRAHIVNNAQDLYEHRIGQLFAAIADQNTDLATKIAQAVRDEPSTQERIDQLCPRPLVSPTPIGASP